MPLSINYIYSPSLLSFGGGLGSYHGSFEQCDENGVPSSPTHPHPPYTIRKEGNRTALCLFTGWAYAEKARIAWDGVNTLTGTITVRYAQGRGGGTASWGLHRPLGDLLRPVTDETGQIVGDNINPPPGLAPYWSVRPLYIAPDHSTTPPGWVVRDATGASTVTAFSRMLNDGRVQVTVVDDDGVATSDGAAKTELLELLFILVIVKYVSLA